jgi:predicted nucleotidyltransferase
VDLDSDRNLFDLGGLQMDLKELLGCKVDVVTKGCLREKICSKIKKEAVYL